MSTPDASAWNNAAASLEDRRAEVADLLAGAVAERDRLNCEHTILCAQIDHAAARVQMYRAARAALERATDRASDDR